MASPSFWNGRRVLLTGHTGFKGSWLALWLSQMGAVVHGLALEPESQPNLFDRLAPIAGLTSQIGDIRDIACVARAIEAARPSVVIHMAAQAFVRRSYRMPMDTVATNVDGTLTVLEALRTSERAMGDLAAVLVVTTDKVYRNSNDGRAFAEDDPLGGHDPYSASKAAAEVLTACWAQSFFEPAGVPVLTARAGNVVGGGDWSEDRLAPDLWRARQAGEAIVLRHPEAVRPWQFVLEPLDGYLTFIEAAAAATPDLPSALNFGPASGDILTVAEAATQVLNRLGSNNGWVLAEGVQPVEARLLSLNSNLAQQALGWRCRLTAREALEWTADWYAAVDDGRDARSVTLAQLERYRGLDD